MTEEECLALVAQVAEILSACASEDDCWQVFMCYVRDHRTEQTPSLVGYC